MSSAARAREMPAWLMWIGSAAIVLHLTALGALALSARSGPWVTPFGNTPAEGPQFAQAINGLTTNYYLRYLGMTHNYHFLTSQASFPGVALEVRLRDAEGNLIKTVKFPEEDANFWVRHRQAMLAQAIGDDQPAPARGGEALALQGDKARKLNFWLEPQEVAALQKTRVLLPQLPTLDPVPEGKKANRLVLVPVRADDRNNVPDRMTLSTPSDWSLILAKAYVRHLARKHNAATAELIRVHRSAIPPELMFAEQPPADMFNPFIDWVSHFGIRDGRTGEFVE
jgi:hypothetical protein